MANVPSTVVQQQYIPTAWDKLAQNLSAYAQGGAGIVSTLAHQNQIKTMHQELLSTAVQKAMAMPKEQALAFMAQTRLMTPQQIEVWRNDPMWNEHAPTFNNAAAMSSYRNTMQSPSGQTPGNSPQMVPTAPATSSALQIPSGTVAPAQQIQAPPPAQIPNFLTPSPFLSILQQNGPTA